MQYIHMHTVPQTDIHIPSHLLRLYQSNPLWRKWSRAEWVSKLNAYSYQQKKKQRMTQFTHHVITLTSVTNRGGLTVISAQVGMLTKASEKVIRREIQDYGVHCNIALQTRTQVLSYIQFNNIHKEFSCAIHSTDLIKTIVQRYITIRIHCETHKSSFFSNDNIKSKFNRLVIFQHQ
jgi:hypothetical protein